MAHSLGHDNAQPSLPLFYDSKRGVYNFVDPPATHPQPQTHRASAYRALAHGPLPSLAYAAYPIEPQPREPQPREPEPMGS